MPPRRPLALMSAEPAPGGGNRPLGSLKRITELMSNFSTAPDGSPPGQMGTHRLHGPGMVVEIPAGQDQIAQAMVTLVEEEIAWAVLTKLCRALKWKMIDLETGRSFG